MQTLDLCLVLATQHWSQLSLLLFVCGPFTGVLPNFTHGCPEPYRCDYPGYLSPLS